MTESVYEGLGGDPRLRLQAAPSWKGTLVVSLPSWFTPLIRSFLSNWWIYFA